LLFKNADKLTIKNRLYAIAVCSLYILTAGISSWLTFFADNWRQFIIYYLLASTIVIIVGIVLYTNPDFLEGLARKYLRSGLHEDTMKRIAGKIKQSFSNEKVFLQNELSLDKLSKHIDEKPHYISQTLSAWVGENFNDFLNRHRVEHAKELLANSQFDHFKIEGIALESGFNNKATFNKAFVKFTAMTPSVFKRVTRQGTIL
jgi:AraC-like DNA-binding protein